MALNSNEPNTVKLNPKNTYLICCFLRPLLILYLKTRITKLRIKIPRKYKKTDILKGPKIELLPHSSISTLEI